LLQSTPKGKLVIYSLLDVVKRIEEREERISRLEKSFACERSVTEKPRK